MAQVINTNIASLNAQRNLNHSQGALNTALERLSTGLRINSAKDDSAGLAISERMSAQIRGLNQAARNANDGISLAQTAEGALQEIGNNLQRVRELAVQSANATNSASDRAAMQAEAAQLISEITRVAGNTQFNGINLLDGSFASQSFQIGANANQTIDVASIGDARASMLGSNVLSTGGTHMGKAIASVAANTVPDGAAAAPGAFTLATAGGTTAAIGYGANPGADGVAAAINNAAGSTGISAVATNSATLSDLSAAGTITMELNGQSISANVSSNGDLSALAAAINGVAAGTGVSASFADPNNLASLTLSTTDGRDIRIRGFDHSVVGAEIDVSGLDGNAETLTDGAANDSTRVVGNVDIFSSKGEINTTAAADDVFAAAGTNNSSFSSVASLSVATSTGAQSALRVLDEALQQVNSSRGDLGALQNRFSSIISSLQTTSENLAASRSRIQDADFAAETANMTRGQIMQQAGVAILAQANALPNNVLSLLR